MEHTFILIKPDAYRRRLIGKIISRFEDKGMTLTAMKVVTPTKELVDKHYEEHFKANKPWYPGVRDYFMSGKVCAMVWSGVNVVKEARRIIGATHPQEALPGTIRGDFGMDVGRNMIHGSDSNEAAKKEIELWFGNNFEFEKSFDHSLLYEK